MRKNTVRGFGISLIMLLAIAMFFYFNFTTVIVSGHSMEPTYHTGQRLLACKAYWLVGGIRDNDIVVIRPGEGPEYLIKRVFKTEGEVVDWVNAPADWKLSEGEYHVPKGNIFVIGDNRPVSDDSRSFGSVPLDRVIGKIVRH